MCMSVHNVGAGFSWRSEEPDLGTVVSCFVGSEN